MSELYSERDVLEAIRITYLTMKVRASRGITVAEIRDAMAWIVYDVNSKNGDIVRERFYRNHSNKWVLRKLRILRRQGNAIDRKFRWYLSDAEVVAQKLIGNFK